MVESFGLDRHNDYKCPTDDSLFYFVYRNAIALCKEYKIPTEESPEDYLHFLYLMVTSDKFNRVLLLIGETFSSKKKQDELSELYSKDSFGEWKKLNRWVGRC